MARGRGGGTQAQDVVVDARFYLGRCYRRGVFKRALLRWRSGRPRVTLAVAPKSRESAELFLRTSPSARAPSAPMLLCHSSSVVSAVFTLSACARDLAPLSPTRLSPRYSVVRTALCFNMSASAPAPSLLIELTHKYLWWWVAVRSHHQ